MVSTEQHRRHFKAAVLSRSRVLGELEQAAARRKGVVGARLLVAQHARHEPDHRVDHNHGGHLAAIQDEVSDGDFIRLEDLANPFVETLVAPAKQHEPLVRGELLDPLLIEPPSLRRQHHQVPGIAALAADAFNTGDDRVRFEQHARAAAKRAVVDGPVPIGGPVTDVVPPDLDEPSGDGQLQDART